MNELINEFDRRVSSGARIVLSHVTGAAVLFLASMVSCASSAAAVSLKVTSGPHEVFLWQRDRCDDDDYPDTPLRAFRDSNGDVVAMASHFDVRRLKGVTFDALRRDCAVARRSVGDADPSKFNDRIWASSTWTDDGLHVYVLGHHEYQAYRHPGRCIFTASESNKCWYNTIEGLGSSNSGANLEKSRRANPIAALDMRSEDRQGEPRGFLEPSNMISVGAYVYAFLLRVGEPGTRPGNCLFRTHRTAVGLQWTYWTGTTWFDAAVDPYRDRTADPAGPLRPPCWGVMGSRPVGSVVRHVESGMYVAVQNAPRSPGMGAAVAFASSRDLFEWSGTKVFFTLGDPEPLAPCASTTFSYPSLVDINSSTRNFEDVGRKARLYMTRFRKHNCSTTSERDLVYFDVTIDF